MVYALSNGQFGLLRTRRSGADFYVEVTIGLLRLQGSMFNMLNLGLCL